MSGINKYSKAAKEKEENGISAGYMALNGATKADMAEVCKVREEADAPCMACVYFDFCEGKLKEINRKYYQRRLKGGQYYADENN